MGWRYCREQGAGSANHLLSFGFSNGPLSRNVWVPTTSRIRMIFWLLNGLRWLDITKTPASNSN